MARLTLEAMMSIRVKRQASWRKGSRSSRPVGYFSLRWLTGQGEVRLVGNVGAHFDPIRTAYRKKTPSRLNTFLPGAVAVSLRINHAEENFYRGESWQSPDTVPMTDEQMKEMKLKRQ